MRTVTLINNIRFSKKQYDLIRPFLLERGDDGFNRPKKGLEITAENYFKKPRIK